LPDSEKKIEPKVFSLLTASMVLTIIAEFAFTFYVSVYGISNFIGHLFKIAAFYLVYKAIIVTGITRPNELLFRELKTSEAKLEQEHTRLQNYLDIAGVMLLVVGSDHKIKLVNKRGCEILGGDEKEIIGLDFFEKFLPQSRRGAVLQIFNRLMAGELSQDEYTEGTMLNMQGKERIFSWHNAVLYDSSGKVSGVLRSGEDITERRLVEKEREDLIVKLTDALTQVKTLSGFLPICANCKKIRDDQGYWHAVERYVMEHSSAEFTHSLCPDCIQKLYPDYFEEKRESS
jgi:PAS domain S-box-containing protein